MFNLYSVVYHHAKDQDRPQGIGQDDTKLDRINLVPQSDPKETDSEDQDGPQAIESKHEPAAGGDDHIF